MKNFRKPILLTALALLFLSGYSQTSKDFPKEVNLVKMTDAGVAIVGTDDALYGLDNTGKDLWKNEKLRKVEPEKVEVLKGSELVFVSDKSILSRNRVLNVLDGREYANTGIKGENLFGARVIHATNQLWVLSQPKIIDVWDIESNAYLYRLEATPAKISFDESASYTYTFSGMQPLTHTSSTTAILHLGLGHLGEYDLTTGKPKWMFDWTAYKPKADKGDKASNPSSRYAVMKLDGGTLYFPFRNMLIAVDAKSGESKWDVKANAPGKVLDMYVTDYGILVLTGSGIQLIDKSTGEEVWKKPLKIKEAISSLLLKDGEDIYAISKTSLLKVDIANQKATALTEKIKFKNKDEISGIEVFEEKIVLSTPQNIVGIDKQSGSILHSVYYEAPGTGLATIAANVVLATVAMAATANSYNVNSISGSQTYFQYTPAVMSSGGSETLDNGKITYISTKFKDSDAKGFGVARVDKTSGETLNKIVIGDRNPIYDVDETRGMIFFKSDNKTVSIQSMD
ncbi:MAG: hypothetical protein ABJG41_10935 [Cyclobacteriaceae bacterium]